MSDAQIFDFGSDTVARAYDEVLVPVMFRPWAADLISRGPAWNGLVVVDLAAGTGIVTEMLVEAVGEQGYVYAVDPNPAMLSVARARTEPSGRVTFIEGAAESIDLPDNSVDAVVCQQGMQFFPDRSAAASEIHRILKPGGRVLASAWAAPKEGTISALLIDTLADIGEHEISELIRLPFANFGAADFLGMFYDGFEDVDVKLVAKDLILPGGPDGMVDLAYATPIGPRLVALPADQRAEFERHLRQRALALSGGSEHMGELESHVLSAVKAEG